MLIEEGKDYPFPLELWDRVVIPPKIIKKAAAQYFNNYPTTQKKFAILDILSARGKLMDGTSISLKSSEELGVIQSLIDGFYTAHPKPKEEEQYFVSRGTPVTLTLYLPYKTSVRRILLNTPASYSAMSPRNITVAFSKDNKRFNQETVRENLTPDQWSPNRGIMRQINLDKKIDALAIRLTTTGASNTIVLDEIVVDNDDALKYSPQEIQVEADNTYHYIDSKELLEQLMPLKRYHQLTLVWACAEDSDWNQQLKNRAESVSGIWYLTKVNIPQANYIEDSITINCLGAKLRKIFFVSPPYPVEMEVIGAVIE